jgi:hypothetical protein
MSTRRSSARIRRWAWTSRRPRGRRCSSIVARVERLRLPVTDIALAEALLCPETLKCVEHWLEKDERERAQALLAARLDEVHCGTSLPVVATATARRVGTRPGDLMGSRATTQSRALSPAGAARPGRAAIEQRIRCQASLERDVDDPLSVPRPAPYRIVPIEGHPGAEEVEAYLQEWKAIAAHEQAVLDGKCADAGDTLAPDVNPADSLAYWAHEYSAHRRRCGLGRLQSVGMLVSGKPVANADAESGFSRLKRISDPHRQNMKIETLQYLFVASENQEFADPALRILIRRFLEARRQRSSSFFAAPRMEHGLHPAEYFVWETRREFLKPIGRIHEAMPGHDPEEGDGDVVVDDLIEWLRAVEDDAHIDLSGDEFAVDNLEEDDVVDEDRPLTPLDFASLEEAELLE